MTARLGSTVMVSSILRRTAISSPGSTPLERGADSALCRMASSGKQLLEPAGQRQPARPPVASTASLERQAFRLGFALALEPVLMGQLSKCLVVQHGSSSFLVLIA